MATAWLTWYCSLTNSDPKVLDAGQVEVSARPGDDEDDVGANTQHRPDGRHDAHGLQVRSRKHLVGIREDPS